MDTNSLFELLQEVSPQRTQNKPHKAIALLAIINCIDLGKIKENQVFHDKNYKEEFSKYFNKYKREADSNRPHTPFFHLKSTNFWRLIPKRGKEEEFSKATSIGGPGKLDEIVDYAEFSAELFSSLMNPVKRKAAKRFLIENLEKISNESHTPNKEIKSKFPHEQQALEKIYSEIENHVELIPNYDLYDPSTNQYLECDLIVVSTACIGIVELKHWAGEIVVRNHEWLRGPYQTPWDDPHRSNGYKCKVLRSFCTKKFPYIKKNFWFESFVLLTNPDATVHNASRPDTTQNNPTFDGIDTFAHFFKRRLNEPNPPLNKSQVKQIADRLRSESKTPRRKGLHIPGYEILENLTKSSHLIELLARPSSNELQTVKRLRIFSVDINLSSEEREKQRIKSLNSLKSLTRISDHPNILKVWDIHHEDGLVVEASDWSQKDGTLANVIQKDGSFPIEKAVSVIRGIAKGLKAVHEEGIVHRNLTPENIMMFGDIPKLMNFDLSYIPEDNRLTVLPDDVILPESPYLAPELYLRQPFSEATDLYSLGVIAHELLVGVPPFSTSTDLVSDSESISKSMQESLTQADVPETLQTLIVSLIEKDRLKRPQDIAEVLMMLDDVADAPPHEEEQIPEPNRILKVGEISSVYTIEAMLGRGREAQVYSALQGSERYVAIKLFHQDVSYSRVDDERNALDSVQSPYIIRCETVHQWDDGRFCMVLNLVDGQPLKEFMLDNDRPDLDTFEQVARCLLQAVATMHLNQNRKSTLLHNDIKPENILIGAHFTPVLIDFGTASPPRIGPYMGTGAYVAPDLFQGAEYEFCESGDLFALGVTLFEWMCGSEPYAGTPSVTVSPRRADSFRKDLPDSLIQWLEKAVQPLRNDRFQDVEEMADAFEAVFGRVEEEEEPEAPEELEIFEAAPACHSEFLDYLNTLHNTTANNENALAESQAGNRFFGSIHVPLSLTDLICEKLTTQDWSHVVLTGHAGDGKSTIGLEVYKRLKEIPMSQPLEDGLATEESIPFGEEKIFIIKDMSELPAEARRKVIEKAIKKEGRWLIISNTGTLLETLEDVGKDYGHSDVEIGDHILRLLQKREPGSFSRFGPPFTLINLSQIDNLQTARQLFEKLVENEHWGICDDCDLIDNCPVFMSLFAVRECKERVQERIGWIYRLLYEYGKRLTMRQISAHLAYALTAGLDCARIREMAEGPIPPQMNEYLFYNRFFGFHGTKPDEKARRLKAIRYLAPMEMGAKPYLPVDRTLWTSEIGQNPSLPERLESVCAGLKEMAVSGYGSAASGARLRQEFRRLFFMFGRFTEQEKGFVAGFTGSPMLVETQSWQEDQNRLTAMRREELKQRVLHVLLEQFTGFHIPDGWKGNELFITLNRRTEALRQSVQILLADIPFSNFVLELEGIYRTFTPQWYVLVLRDKYDTNIRLTLDLPFLDYVLMRSEGELGQRLNRAYLDRLERFKNLLLARNQDQDEVDMKLIEFTNDGSFKQRRVLISEDTLELM